MEELMTGLVIICVRKTKPKRLQNPPDLTLQFRSLVVLWWLAGEASLYAFRAYFCQDGPGHERGELDRQSRLDALVGCLSQRHGHQAVVHVHGRSAVLLLASLSDGGISATSPSSVVIGSLWEKCWFT